ncbi:M15 family metallopeptidase [Marinibacterium profundimaris]|uniref:Peptidase M15C domain-containing protein n=1 Tax=Marinibacterium profundimaris TaxID=1679460 RepID=A0A225NHM4_9RHOB|nr:M15 family metallopeptidase [Marinibacterium profundimaris]OWU72454.1 hypothetical protein ATO3_15295 [Marinibacterium profundimaris]
MLNAIVRCALLLGLAAPVAASDCTARDFLGLTLPDSPGRPAIAIALETAYPGLYVDEGQGNVHMPDGSTVLPLGGVTGRDPAQRLDSPTIAEQFFYTYPLAFDLGPRQVPWTDPGRLRNPAFFEALYYSTQAEAAADMRRVTYAPTGTRFVLGDRTCAATQLDAALRDIAGQGIDYSRFFRNVGGSFNWRRIAGTDRLSAHSFGIALDLNADLGGYWRWSGAAPGAAQRYDNQIPEGIVAALERYGFVWGGKWHHFDGMHFEYRPELILHARLSGDRA